MTVAIIGLAAVLTACGGNAASGSPLGECRIMSEFERTATDAQIRAFRDRVEAIPEVAQVDVLSREETIELVLAQARASRLPAAELDRLEARARRSAGSLLLATPRNERDIPRIVSALTVLPGYVASLIDLPSCDVH